MMKNSCLSKLFAAFIIATVFITLLPCFSIAQQSNKEEETLFVAKKAFEDGFYEVSFGPFERFLTILFIEHGVCWFESAITHYRCWDAGN